MAKVDIGACIGKSVDLYKKDFFAHLIATIIVSVLSGVGFGILFGPLTVGYMKMIKNSEGGSKASIGDVFSGFNDFLPSLIVSIFGGIIVVIGFILCFLPGLLIVAILPAAFYAIAQGEKDGVAALKKAWSVVTANLIMAAICFLVISFIGSLGMILCFVGVIFTLPLINIGQYVLAQQLFAEAA